MALMAQASNPRREGDTMREYADPVDVTTSDELRRLVEQVQKTGQAVPITRDSEIVALVQPAPRTKARPATLPKEAAVAASRSMFGALKGVLDERMMKEIYEARGSSRPPVEL